MEPIAVANPIEVRTDPILQWISKIGRGLRGEPDGSGRDLMRNLAKHYPIRGIAVSGHGMKEDVQSSIAAGFSHHITKPVDWSELKTAIEKIIP